MFQSATFKLTVWYMAIAMCISLAFSGVVYHFATDELARGLNRQSQRIYQQYPVFDHDPVLNERGDVWRGSEHILINLGYLNLIVLVGAGFASYALARRTLGPIEEAHEQQKRFTGVVSHELRTPLTSLKMESEVALLDKNLNKDALRSVIASNVEEANKLDALINNLLRLARLDAGQLQLDFELINAGQLVEQAIAGVQPAADRKHISITKQVQPFEFMGDTASLVQLLQILLDNAIKYSSNRSTVTVRANTASHEAVLVVQDAGAGISPADLERVFERFYRADSSRSSGPTGGQGLGLSIAKLISDVHGGTLTLSSQLGKGTTAEFRLPLKRQS